MEKVSKYGCIALLVLTVLQGLLRYVPAAAGIGDVLLVVTIFLFWVTFIAAIGASAKKHGKRRRK